jgi:hypothetical protein
MRTQTRWLSGVIVVVALGFAFAGAPLAQTTSTTDVRNFEVISVDGNTLVVRDEKGTQELSVPDDFRFTVDGKKMSVSELKAGMKGTATITTTTTVKPVFVTEVREAEVLRASPISVTVRTADGARKFTQTEVDTKGIRIFKNGAPVRFSDLKKGDMLTATVITNGPPTVLTEKEVQAVLAEPEPAPTTVVAAAPAQPTTPAASPPASPQPSAPPPASPPAEQSGLGLTWWLVIAVIIALVVFFVRRRKQT